MATPTRQWVMTESSMHLPPDVAGLVARVYRVAGDEPDQLWLEIRGEFGSHRFVLTGSARHIEAIVTGLSTSLAALTAATEAA